MTSMLARPSRSKVRLLRIVSLFVLGLLLLLNRQAVYAQISSLSGKEALPANPL